MARSGEDHVVETELVAQRLERAPLRAVADDDGAQAGAGAAQHGDGAHQHVDPLFAGEPADEADAGPP